MRDQQSLIIFELPSVIEGTIANYSRPVEVGFGDSANITTDDRGGFFIQNITRGPQRLFIYTSPEELPYYVSFPVPDGTQWKDLGSISLNKISKLNATSHILIPVAKHIAILYPSNTIIDIANSICINFIRL